MLIPRSRPKPRPDSTAFSVTVTPMRRVKGTVMLVRSAPNLSQGVPRPMFHEVGDETLHEERRGRCMYALFRSTHASEPSLMKLRGRLPVRLRHYTVITEPLSTRKFMPFTKLARSEHRNATAAATSSASPRRFSSMPGRSSSRKLVIAS